MMSNSPILCVLLPPYLGVEKLKLKMWRKYNHFGNPQIKSRWLIKEKDITILNIYALDIEAPRYIRQTLADIKEGIKNSRGFYTTIVGDFNTPFTLMDRKLIRKHKS